MIRPAIVVASTLILIQGLRVFDQVQALTGGGPVRATETLATQVYKETSPTAPSATAPPCRW